MWVHIRLLVIILAVVTCLCDALRLSHIEPIRSFSSEILSGSAPTTLNSRGIRDVFAHETEASKTVKNRVRIKFAAFYDEWFDLTLDLDNNVASKARITAGTPGNEEEVSFPPSTYSTIFTNPDATTTIATFTIYPDGKVDGMIVRDGVAYVVTPIDFLEADLFRYEPSTQKRTIELARLNTLKAKSASGMAVYRLSDINTYDEYGNAYYRCIAVSPPTSPVDTPTIPVNPPNGLAKHRGTEEDHVDYASPDMALFSEVAAVTATNTGRKPLLKRWDTCHTAAAGNGKIVYLDLVVDVGAALTFSEPSAKVDVRYVANRLVSITAQLNVFYQTQLAIKLSLNTVVIRTGPSSEEWNVYYPNHADWATKNVTYQQYFDAAAKYRASQPDAEKGAAMQFITVAFPSGVVGQAYIGVLCRRDSSMGFSSFGHAGGFLTLAHELGHNFGAQHTFTTCKDEYTANTGGIMDYSDGILGPESDSPGEVGFHSICSKREICTHLKETFRGKNITLPSAQCFADYTGAAVCGDGIVEGEEECDVFGGDTACCVKCKLVSNATCAVPGPCCVDCKAQSSSTACGVNGHCAIDGSCQATACSAMTGGTFCELPNPKDPCRETCSVSGSPCGAVMRPLSDALCFVDGSDGVCVNGACKAITYDWDAEDKTCTCGGDEQANLQRAVRCKSSDGRYVSEAYCDAKTKPSITVACCDYRWVTSEYSECSNTCGEGVQTRTAYCRNFSRRLVTVPSFLCDSSTKPVLSRPCSSTSTCPAYWRCTPTALGDYASAAECVGEDSVGYGVCTVNCTTASQTREPKCWSRSNSTVVDDSACVTVKPRSIRPCVAPTTISNVVLGASPVVAGDTLQVDWCFYGEPQQLKLSLYVSTNTYVGLLMVPAQDQTATVTLPTNSNPNAYIRLVAADSAKAVSPTFTILSRCGSIDCGVNGACDDYLGVCRCSPGWTGEVCDVSACATIQCLNGATCQIVSSADGKSASPVCECISGYRGAQCEFSDACDQSLCKHGGWCAFVDGVCAKTCSCNSPWQGDSCEVCSLACQNNGKVNGDCTSCVCPSGYLGNDCSCRGALTSLVFPKSAPMDVLGPILQDDLVTLTGLDRQHLQIVESIVTPPSMKVIIALRLCSSTATSTKPTISGTAVTSMAELYLAWAAALHLINSGSSILHSGDAAMLAGSVSSAAQLYDPLCTGTGCPKGSDPYAQPVAAKDDQSGAIIAIAVVCGVALIISIAVYLDCRKRSNKVASAVEIQRPIDTRTQQTAPSRRLKAPISPQTPVVVQQSFSNTISYPQHPMDINAEPATPSTSQPALRNSQSLSQYAYRLYDLTLPASPQPPRSPVMVSQRSPPQHYSNSPPYSPVTPMTPAPVQSQECPPLPVLSLAEAQLVPQSNSNNSNRPPPLRRGKTY